MDFLILKIHMLKIVFLILGMLIFMSCAAIQAPPGGPKDETPPELIETIPSNETVLFKGGRIELIFSEYIDENSVEKAIRVLPIFNPQLETIYKGRRIFIEMPDSLATDQTYIISIDRTLKDEHKVPLAQGIQVAYSTGDKIDQGKISGTVTHSKAVAVQLWKLRGEKAFTQFYQPIPDYVVDASDSGHYEFRFLSDGNYRLAAVEQTASGIPIVPERVLYGLTWDPFIQLGNEKESSNHNIQIPDKMGSIKLAQGQWRSGNWVTLTFTDQIDTWESAFQIKAMADDSAMIVPETFLDPLDGTRLHLTLPDFKKSKYMSFVTNGLQQGDYSIIDTGLVKVKVDTSRDTSFTQVITPKKNFELTIEKEKIVPVLFVFSGLVDTVNMKNPFTVVQDSIPIPCEVNWVSPKHGLLSPIENWMPETKYTLNVFRDKILPIHSRSLKDSLVVISFKTTEFQGHGRLIGSIIDNGMESVVAEMISMEKEPNTYRSVVNSTGMFEMNELPEGNYRLLFFQDSDGNNQYSHGKVQPYISSEWFYEYSDTVKIRTNWDMELNQINLGKNP